MGNDLNILLIEDNPGDAFLIKFYLEESIWKNSNLIHAEYLKTALDLLSKNTFDVIILDLNLPDSTGMETLNAILKEKKDAVVIVLTGLQDEELGMKTVQSGAQDFLVKGQFDGKVFNSSIRYAFERAQTRRELSQSAENISKLEFRFDIVQRLNKTGFWRIILNDKSVLCSDYFYELLDYREKIETLPDFLNLFDKNDREKINHLITSSLKLKKNDEVSLDVSLSNGRKAIITAKCATPKGTSLDVIAGILKLK
jgi:DNA-binding response OmpR family regulator